MPHLPRYYHVLIGELSRRQLNHFYEIYSRNFLMTIYSEQLSFELAHCESIRIFMICHECDLKLCRSCDQDFPTFYSVKVLDYIRIRARGITDTRKAEEMTEALIGINQLVFLGVN